MADHNFDYTPGGDTLRRFMLSDAFFRGVMGPVGSGKSVATQVELFRRATAQAKGRDGIRRTRWAVIRNTNPQLKTTTIKTWHDWFPEHVFGKMNWTPPYTHRMRFGDVDMEVIFLALDRPEDIRKLLSLELTGALMNETREIPKAILDVLTTRVGRFPSMREGGPSWSGILADTNAPAPDHWWPIMAGLSQPPDYMSEAERRLLVRPEGWEFFEQPPGMVEIRNAEGAVTGFEKNPLAENIKNLIPDYYSRIVQGKSQSYINVYVLNRLDEVFDGTPVYPTFNRATHVAKERLQPFPGHIIWVGMDFGLTPAATFGQYVRGRDFLLRELIGTGIGTNRFAPLLKAFIAEHFPGYEFRFFGDPAGDTRVQTDERTPFDILRTHGINAFPTHTNDPLIRQGAVENQLGAMVDGAPAYLVSPCCTTMIRGFEGGYHVKNGSAEKNAFSHPHDAEQYRMLGRGAGRSVTNSGKPAAAGRAAVAVNPRRLSGLSRPSFRPMGL